MATKKKREEKSAIAELWRKKDVRKVLLKNNAENLLTCLKGEGLKKPAEYAVMGQLDKWHKDAWDVPITELPTHFDLMWNHIYPLVAANENKGPSKSLASKLVVGCDTFKDAKITPVIFPAKHIVIIGSEHSKINGIYYEDADKSISSRVVYTNHEAIAGPEDPRDYKHCAKYLYWYDQLGRGLRGWFIAPALCSGEHESLAFLKSDAKKPYMSEVQWEEKTQGPNPVWRKNEKLKVKLPFQGSFREKVGSILCARFQQGDCGLGAECPFQHDQSKIIQYPPDR